MNTTRHEYFSAPGENGNGHVKPFTLAPAKDPLTQKILETREHALKDSRLTGSMKAFFCFILDASLNPGGKGFQKKGTVSSSDSYLASIFDKTDRTIYTWKYRLKNLGYVWLSYLPKTNMEPITVYNISAIVPPQSFGQDRDGEIQSGRPRTGFKASLGARSPGQTLFRLPGVRSAKPAGVIILDSGPLRRKEVSAGNFNGDFLSKSEEISGISPESRSQFRERAEADFGSEPKSTSAENGNRLRLAAEANFGCQPKSTSAQTRNGAPLAAEANRRDNRDSDKRLSQVQREGEGKPPKSEFEEWKNSLPEPNTAANRISLEKMQARFDREAKCAATPEAKREWKLKLKEVEAKLYGGTVADAPAPVKPVAKGKPQPVTEPSLDEVREFLRWCHDNNKLNLFTAKHRAILEAAGEAVAA